MANTTTNTIGTLPAATLSQRLAAMSEVQLAQAAEALAKRGPSADSALTAVLEVLERRLPAASFDAFLAEIFA